MKNKEYFLREDLKTYKPKYLLVCNKCYLIPYIYKVGEQKPHTKIIKIEEICKQ